MTKREVYEGSPPIQLYDLTVDIGERKIVALDNTPIVQKLDALIDQYVRDGRSTPGAHQLNTGSEVWSNYIINFKAEGEQ